MARNFGVTPSADAKSVSIANANALSDTFDMRSYTGGLVMVPDSWSDANIGFKVSDAEAGPFMVAKDKAGVPIQITGINVSTKAAYAIPTELFPAAYVQLWSKHKTAATETDVVQGGARAMKVMLK